MNIEDIRNKTEVLTNYRKLNPDTLHKPTRKIDKSD